MAVFQEHSGKCSLPYLLVDLCSTRASCHHSPSHDTSADGTARLVPRFFRRRLASQDGFAALAAARLRSWCLRCGDECGCTPWPVADGTVRCGRGRATVGEEHVVHESDK